MDPKPFLFLTFSLLTSLNAVAGEKPLVIFFGGSGTSQSELALWKKSAQAAMGQFEYETVAFPGSNHKKPAALAAGAHIISQTAERLNQMQGRKVILVGHSSGGALAEAVALKIRDPKNFSLVNLDGFRIDKKLQERMHVTCWSGRNPATGGTSTNYSAMQSSCRNFREYTMNSSSCRSEWCLHFSIVNRSAGPTGGYSAAVNLAWLSDLIPGPGPVPPAPQVVQKPPAGNSGTTFILGDIPGTR